METSFEQVKEFYRSFDQEMPPADSSPSLSNHLLQLRLNLKMDLIAEEFFELVEAVYGPLAAELISANWDLTKASDEMKRDVVGAADALADLIYVINGLAIEANIPLDDVFGEVHQSNMSKLGPDSRPIMSDGVTPAAHDGKIKPAGKLLKGPDYREPDIAKVLAQVGPTQQLTLF